MLTVLLLLGCPGPDKDGPDKDDTAPIDTAPTQLVCNTRNESCAPNTCGGSGSDMLPGSDCLACHRSGGADAVPTWTVAGTAFTERLGQAALSGATIRVTGADGMIVEMTTNAVGNFYTDAAIVTPYRAEIAVGGQVRAMEDPVGEGGCNGCHSCLGVAGAKLFGL